MVITPFEADLRNATSLRRARGYVGYDAGRLNGWILHPLIGVSSVELFLDDTAIGSAALEPVPSVGRDHPHIDHAVISGFSVPFEPADTSRLHRFRVIGYSGDTPAVAADCLLLIDVDAVAPASQPLPPQELITRVSGSPDQRLHRSLGYRYCMQLLEQVQRYGDISGLKNVLDWGCGCGRLTFHVQRNCPPGCLLDGCDVDAEAVQWCSENLAPARFTVIDPSPPTVYPPSTFDLVMGLSVITGLAREGQKVWLDELARIIAPGGLLLISIQGLFSASFLYPSHQLDVLFGNGIFDSIRREQLNGSVEIGPYLGTFQTIEYVKREWLEHFELLDWLEGEINSDQDLLVLRRRA